MINTKITVDGTEYVDSLNITLKRSTSKFSATTNFNITLPSPYGRHKDNFTIGDEVIIYADEDTDPATTKLMTGIIEDIKFQGIENTQQVSIRGRDYTARLMDTTVEPVVYTDSEVSTIVKNIIDNELSGQITYTNVATTETTLKRIAFNHVTIMDAFKQLGELSGYYFYIDNNKDLNFKKNENIDSGVTLDNSNILKMDFDTTREGMANDIWVYGDRYLAGFEETLSADGGSVFSLISKPHDSYVEYLGTPQKGGVFQMTNSLESGVDYLVSYQDKEIIFTSGTAIGSSVPANGGSILVRYNREVPIVKTGQNRPSVQLYGLKRKIINDKSIKDPNTAEEILKAEIANADPFRGIRASIKGWLDINPGETLKVELDNFDLDEENIPISSITYKFDKNTIQSGKVITIELDKKLLDITDEITNLRKRLELIESADRQDTDIITRLEISTGSFTIIGSYWEVRTRFIGSDYLWGVSQASNPFVWGVAGSGLWLGSYAYPTINVMRSGGYY